MNRYRRTNNPAQPTQSTSDASSLNQSGNQQAMYFIEEPKRPNIISRAKIRHSQSNTTVPTLISQPIGITISSASQSVLNNQQQKIKQDSIQSMIPQQQQIIIQTTQDNQQQQFLGPVDPATAVSLNLTAEELEQNQELLNQISNANIASTSANSLDDFSLSLLSDENTQTLLNSGQYETIETADGNLLLILNEDIEKKQEGSVFANVSTTPDNAVLMTFSSDMLGTSTNPSTNYILENDVTTCTSAIESPISSVGINTSVVEQHQEQIEQQQQFQPNILQLPTDAQAIDPLGLSPEQIAINPNPLTSNAPQQYVLVQLEDGTSFLVAPESLESITSAFNNASVNNELAAQFQMQSTATDESNSTTVTPTDTVAAHKRKSATKPKASKPKPVITKTQPKPLVTSESQPPPLVPITRKPTATTTTSPASEQRKPYRFIMESEEDRKEAEQSMNPFIIKVLSAPEEKGKNVSPTKVEPATLSRSPPKLILKSPGSLVAVCQQPANTVQPNSTTSPPKTSEDGKEKERSTNNGVNKDKDNIPGNGVIELGNGMFKCSLCAKTTKLRIHMENHVNRLHRGEMPFKCAECGEAFQYQAGLRAHQQKEHVLKVYKCVPCNIEFSCESELKSHFTLVHSNEKNFVVVSSTGGVGKNALMEPASVCEVCLKIFNCKFMFMKHKAEHWDPGSGNGKISCDSCKQEFSLKLNYFNHVQAHKDGHTKYACEICAKGFKTENYLKNHNETHKKQQKSTYTPITPTSTPSTTVKITYSTASQLLKSAALSSPAAPIAEQSSKPTTSTEMASQLLKAPATMASQLVTAQNVSSPKKETSQTQPDVSTSISSVITKELTLPKNTTLNTAVKKPPITNQVYLCSRCDLIFISSEELRKHFTDRHPDLMGKHKVILRSKKVPATYLQTKLLQQNPTKPKTLPVSVKITEGNKTLSTTGIQNKIAVITTPATATGSQQKIIVTQKTDKGLKQQTPTFQMMQKSSEPKLKINIDKVVMNIKKGVADLSKNNPEMILPLPKETTPMTQSASASSKACKPQEPCQLKVRTELKPKSVSENTEKSNNSVLANQASKSPKNEVKEKDEETEIKNQIEATQKERAEEVLKFKELGIDVRRSARAQGKVNPILVQMKFEKRKFETSPEKIVVQKSPDVTNTRKRKVSNEGPAEDEKKAKIESIKKPDNKKESIITSKNKVEKTNGVSLVETSEEVKGRGRPKKTPTPLPKNKSEVLKIEKDVKSKSASETSQQTRVSQRQNKGQILKSDTFDFEEDESDEEEESQSESEPEPESTLTNKKPTRNSKRPAPKAQKSSPPPPSKITKKAPVTPAKKNIKTVGQKVATNGRETRTRAAAKAAVTTIKGRRK